VSLVEPSIVELEPAPRGRAIFVALVVPSELEWKEGEISSFSSHFHLDLKEILVSKLALTNYLFVVEQ
jgi:hypothetical protein